MFHWGQQAEGLTGARFTMHIPHTAVLQMRKLRYTEDKQLVQNYKVQKDKYRFYIKQVDSNT